MAKNKLKKSDPDRLPLGKFLAWRGGAFSLAANFIIMGYLTIYCTDTLKMPAVLVGTLLLASKILDAVGELFAGYLIDSTNTKLGKGRPYDLFLIGLWAGTVLLFSTPQSLGLVGKSIWVVFFYTLVMSVFQTLIAAASMSYTMRAFTTKQQIVKLQSYGGIVGTLLSVTVSVSFPMVMKTMATSASGWTKLLVIYAIPLLVIGLTRFIFVKETVKIDDNVDKQERLKFSEIFQVLKTNKYIWITCGLTLIVQLMNGMGAGTYYFKYVVGDISKFGTLQMLTIPMLVVMFIFPKFIRKYSVSALISGGAVLGVIGGIIAFFAGANIPMLLVASVFTGLAALPPAYMGALMILDCAKYNLQKGQKSMEATLSSINNFGTNVGSGIGSAVVGLMLGAAGYVGDAAAQTPAAIFAIRSLYSLVPVLLYVIIIILMRFYDVEKKVNNVTAQQQTVQM